MLPKGREVDRLSVYGNCRGVVWRQAGVWVGYREHLAGEWWCSSRQEAGAVLYRWFEWSRWEPGSEGLRVGETGFWVVEFDASVDIESDDPGDGHGWWQNRGGAAYRTWMSVPWCLANLREDHCDLVRCVIDVPKGFCLGLKDDCLRGVFS